MSHRICANVCVYISVYVFVPFIRRATQTSPAREEDEWERERKRER